MLKDFNFPQILLKQSLTLSFSIPHRRAVVVEKSGNFRRLRWGIGIVALQMKRIDQLFCTLKVYEKTSDFDTSVGGIERRFHVKCGGVSLAHGFHLVCAAL